MGGGNKSVIPHAIPSLSGCEAWHVVQALNANEPSSGSFVRRFESSVAEATGASFAVAVSSGSAALHLALLLAGVKAGDKVVVPACTFVATANAVIHSGAEPVIIDVEPETWGLDPNKLEDYLRSHTVAAVLPVHLYGHPCQLDAIQGVAARYGAAVVEDAAESLGARYKGLPVGSDLTACQRPLLACLSFNGNKIVTTGGGGMVLTDTLTLADKCRRLATQSREDADALIYGFGFNYRMPNLNAALGLGQMETFSRRLEAKRATHAHYAEHLPMFREQPYCQSAYWLPAVHVGNAEGARAKLAEAGIESRRVWRPLNMQPHLKDCEAFHVEVAERLYEEWLTLPSSVGITEEERCRVIDALR